VLKKEDLEASVAILAAGLTAYVGPPGGFVLRFSNGLTAYLSGDTGITAEQDLVVRGHYKANLAVMNVGGFPFTTGPDEAAYVVNDLVRPNSVIISHVNEPATVGGKVAPNIVAAEERAALPPQCWRMVWTNPANGRRALPPEG